MVYIAFMLLITSCENEIDNYEAPNGGVFGTIFDKETNEPIPLPVQGSSGVLINLFELNTNATESVDFRANQNGTYQNSKVFNNDYRIRVNGPFAGFCEGYVTINGQTEFNLYTLPLARISVDVELSSNNKVLIKYDVEKIDENYPLNDVFVMWNYSPGVDINVTNHTRIASKGSSLQGTHVFDLLNDTEFIENHYKIQANDNKIYIRIAAKTTPETSKRSEVNYSKVVELTLNDL